MPKSWTPKDERKYRAILESCVFERGQREVKACKRVAAATVNRDRKRRRQGLGAPPGLEIREVDTGVKNSFRFEALLNGHQVGDIYATKSKVGGQVVYAIRNVDVAGQLRRQGIATKLYEAAAQEACRRRVSLASVDRTPTAHSHDFWFKQLQKGRARTVGRGKHPKYVLDCAFARDLSGLGRVSKADDLEARWGYRVTQEQVADGAHAFYVKNPRGQKAGYLALEVHDIEEGDIGEAWQVSYIEVEPAERSKRLGTKLYEMAAEFACDTDRPLVSDRIRTPLAEAFWRKQVAKGRARPVQTGTPGAVPYHLFIQAGNAIFSAAYEDARRDLVKEGLSPRNLESRAIDAGVRAQKVWEAKLPPFDLKTQSGRPAWATERYVLDACGTWRDLSGLRKRRRRR